MRITNFFVESAAVKICIADIIKSTPAKNEEGRVSSIKLKDGRTIANVRVMATIVEKFVSSDSNYASLTIDDGTETILVKFFKGAVSKILSLEIGVTLDVIGPVREYEEELYISPNIIFEIENPNSELLRQAELLKTEKKEEKEVPAVDINTAVLMKIKELSDEKGVDLKVLIKNLKEFSEEAAMEAVRILMLKGDLFEPKKGRLKLVE